MVCTSANVNILFIVKGEMSEACSAPENWSLHML